MLFFDREQELRVKSHSNPSHVALPPPPSKFNVCAHSPPPSPELNVGSWAQHAFHMMVVNMDLTQL